MNKILSTSKAFLKRHLSTILSCVAATGVVATSVMAVKATPKAMELLEESKKEKEADLTKAEIIRIAAPVYIPSILVGASTLVCIFGANFLNKRKQASLISAYALLNSSYKEYRNKVTDIYGEEANSNIVEELAKDKYEKGSFENDEKQLFYDDFSNRYFESTMVDVQRAEYLLNRDLSFHGYVCLNNFYDLLKIDPVDGGDELGWSTGEMFDMYWHSWIEFDHKMVTMDDGLECCIITLPLEPVPDYLEY